MQTIRAILIDPFSKTVTEHRIEQGSDDGYSAMVRAIYNGERGLITFSGIGAGHSIVVDDEGQMMDWDHQAFFQLGSGEASATFAGRALIVASDSYGNTTPCRLPLSLVQSTCRWIEAKDVEVPAPVMTTIGKDGQLSEELLAGTRTWNYKNQPV